MRGCGLAGRLAILSIASKNPIYGERMPSTGDRSAVDSVVRSTLEKFGLPITHLLAQRRDMNVEHLFRLSDAQTNHSGRH